MVDNNSNSFIPVASPSGLPARLGRNLAARRKALGLTQAQVAERLEVETETLSRFERGKHVPSLLTLERLAAVLGTTCGDLLQETPQLPVSDVLVLATWLADLPTRDVNFVQQVVKVCCEYLGARPALDAPESRQRESF